MNLYRNLCSLPRLASRMLAVNHLPCTGVTAGAFEGFPGAEGTCVVGLVFGAGFSFGADAGSDLVPGFLPPPVPTFTPGFISSSRLFGAFCAVVNGFHLPLLPILALAQGQGQPLCKRDAHNNHRIHVYHL